MNQKLLLFIVTLGGVFLLGFFGYRYWKDSLSTSALEFTQPALPKNESPTSETTSSRGEAPAAKLTPAAAPAAEEDIPKAPSTSKKQFESEDDAPDTTDSVTIEVEPDDE